MNGNRSRSGARRPIPSPSGSRTSTRATSKLASAARARADFLSGAIVVRAPRVSTISARLSASEGSSSTMRTCAGHQGSEGTLSGMVTRKLAPCVGRLDDDRAAVHLDDAPAEREPEAAALGLGREQRLEHPRPDVDRYAGTVVTDPQRGRAGLAMGLHPDAAAAVHGLDAVGQQVDQHLPKLIRVDVERDPGRKSAMNRDGGRDGGELDGAGHQLAERRCAGGWAGGCGPAPGDRGWSCWSASPRARCDRGACEPSAPRRWRPGAAAAGRPRIP